jgi:hypothetical protein
LKQVSVADATQNLMQTDRLDYENQIMDYLDVEKDSKDTNLLETLAEHPTPVNSPARFHNFADLLFELDPQGALLSGALRPS